MDSANTLAQTAQTLMSQLANNTINFASYKDSVNTIIASANNNPDFKLENNSEAVHTVDIAIRLSKGEAPPVRRR
jgi:hypothetical protein